MPQHSLKNFEVGDRPVGGARSRPYDVVDGDFRTLPGENHVAALQSLIYARFVTDDEQTAALPNNAGEYEDGFAKISRVGGVIVLIAALAVLAVVIF